LSEECRLRVFDNRVLRRIFGRRRDEVTGERRRLHNKELYAFYSTAVFWMMKSIKVRWARHVERVGERKDVYRVLVGKRERRSPHGRPRQRWDHNIKMDLTDVGGGGMDWIDVA
jgi:hypothetical protein